MADSISAERLIGMLREYEARAQAAHGNLIESHVEAWRRGLSAFGASLVVFLVLVSASLIASHFAQMPPVTEEAQESIASSVLWISVIVGFMVLLLNYVTLPAKREDVGLATWHLRRVFELASRHEDMGAAMDTATRVELEMKLSSAIFMLQRLRRFDKPAKYRHLSRAGTQSPLRTLEGTVQTPFEGQSRPTPIT